ncbi:MAG: hybrid sensor histidine kinase/response regulator [Microcoleaceae cyanobacterium]|jgi:signal transduction histidine kinase
MTLTVKILVVEDEAVIGMDIRNTLLKLGYEVPPVVMSGEEAIHKAQEYQPDLILMDIVLKKGGIDGIEAAKQIRDHLIIPIIFLTAHSDIKTLERSKNTDPFGYIIKPFKEKDLHTMIEIALARSKGEKELLKILKEQQEINELKSRFVSMVSHEFRTPLATIALSAGLLDKYAHKWQLEKQKVHFSRIISSVQQMTELLNDILTIGQVESGNVAFNPNHINLETFMEEMLEERENLDQNQHKIEYQCEGDLTDVVMDEKLLRHILSNLISNALKYSPEGRDVKIKLLRMDNWVKIRIQDYGIGIPPEDKKQLFEMFHRAQNVGTIQGTGVGLAIVKRAVDMHGGEIDVESEQGKGTIFTVTLPLDRESAFVSSES